MLQDSNTVRYVARVIEPLEKEIEQMKLQIEELKQQRSEGLPCVNHNLFGYFKHGGVKWLLVEIDGNMLKGIDITPKGMVHTLHINKKEVYELVTLSDHYINGV